MWFWFHVHNTFHCHFANIQIAHTQTKHTACSSSNNMERTELNQKHIVIHFHILKYAQVWWLVEHALVPGQRFEWKIDVYDENVLFKCKTFSRFSIIYSTSSCITSVSIAMVQALKLPFLKQTIKSMSWLIAQRLKNALINGHQRVQLQNSLSFTAYNERKRENMLTHKQTLTCLLTHKHTTIKSNSKCVRNLFMAVQNHLHYVLRHVCI